MTRGPGSSVKISNSCSGRFKLGKSRQTSFAMAKIPGRRLVLTRYVATESEVKGSHCWWLPAAAGCQMRNLLEFVKCARDYTAV